MRARGKTRIRLSNVHGDITRNPPFFSKTSVWNAPDPEEYYLDVGTSDCGAINLEKVQDFQWMARSTKES
jgi:hypothetical protein